MTDEALARLLPGTAAPSGAAAASAKRATPLRRLPVGR